MIKIGKIVNTHGIRGELRVIDGPRYGCHDFIDTGYVFIKDKKYQLSKARPHKQFMLITLKDFNNINDVLKFKDEFIYVEGEETFDPFQPMHILNKEVYFEDKVFGVAKSYLETPKYFIVVFDNGVNVPLTDHFLDYVDKKWILKRKVG